MGLCQDPTVKRYETCAPFTVISLSHFKLQLAFPVAYDGPGDFDDWLTRPLSYISLDIQRYKVIAQHYTEYSPEAHTKEHLALFYDADI